MTFLEDLINRRGKPTEGYSSVWPIELVGGTIIEPTAFEPDPKTYRGEYYYNANANVLYKKIISKNSTHAYWQKISD